MKVNVRAKRILASLAAALLMAALGATPGTAQTTDVDRAMGVMGSTGLPTPGGAMGITGPEDIMGTTQKGTKPKPKPKPLMGAIGSLDGILKSPKPKPKPKPLTGAIRSLDVITPRLGATGLTGPSDESGKAGVITPSMRTQ